MCVPEPMDMDGLGLDIGDSRNQSSSSSSSSSAAAKAKAKPSQVFLSDVHCFDMDACAWSVPGSISAAPDGSGADAATAAVGGTAVSERAPAGRRNAQAVYVDASSSLLLVCDFCM